MGLGGIDDTDDEPGLNQGDCQLEPRGSCRLKHHEDVSRGYSRGEQTVLEGDKATGTLHNGDRAGDWLPWDDPGRNGGPGSNVDTNKQTIGRSRERLE
jgi:hypothetical protein